MTPSDLHSVTRTMDRILDEVLGNGGAIAPSSAGEAGSLPTFTLPVDVFETDAAYVLTAPVPGFDRDQVELTYDQGVLTITARAQPLQVQGKWLRQERPHGSWFRRLQLPEQVEGERIQADFDLGLLTVTIPKVAKAQPVRIPVAGGKKSLKA
jgi:HSP20 family protein